MVQFTARSIASALRAESNPVKAKILTGFFKTGVGAYGEGDVFWGITVPRQRVIAKEFHELPLTGIGDLLDSPVHECRLTALLILVSQFEKAEDEKTRKQIFDFYRAHFSSVNNWDLVDLSAPSIAGRYLLDRNAKILFRWAKSNHLWTRRIAIVSTYAFIKKNRFNETLKIVESLLSDSHDLLHKAVGWMLREVGKRDEKVLIGFLDSHAAVMPRTMLRYSIERLPERKRKAYLAKKG
ncbi:MAG: DNA alkylation repair protein [Candidatus Diapherotrites archaeon]|nr:DNA alkylation repair protein [Candidatus Diapherotrites archaeon]